MNITALPEFSNHRSVLFLQDEEVHLRGFLAVHCGGIDKPTFGATRFTVYENEEAALRDALRLSKCMSYKSAMAGLPYGGAKAVLMAGPETVATRNGLLKKYAQFLEHFAGQLITGTDVGLSQEDLGIMKEETSKLVGFRTKAEYFTGISVFYGIQAALKEVFGSEDVAGKRIAVQGLGKTGLNLLKLLVEHDAVPIVSDINQERVAAVQAMFPGIAAMESTRLHKEDVDVYAPCALYGAINETTVPELRCSIVAGSANNQLATPGDGEKLYAAGILYVPDYISNSGGLISMADEYEHPQPDERRILRKIENIKNVLAELFKKGRAAHCGPEVISDEIARLICLAQT
jgi:leucine dehydrogenase